MAYYHAVKRIPSLMPLARLCNLTMIDNLIEASKFYQTQQIVVDLKPPKKILFDSLMISSTYKGQIYARNNSLLPSWIDKWILSAPWCCTILENSPIADLEPTKKILFYLLTMWNTPKGLRSTIADARSTRPKRVAVDLDHTSKK